MASAKALAWIDRLVWILIYGGLFALILGVASMSSAPVAAWSLVAIGACLAAAGIILIWVRARLGQNS